jgi:DNA polymerase
MTKQEQLKKLELKVIRCRQCPHLVRSRTQTVFGTGSVDAEFFFLGEAPGRDEDRQGEPFVGRAGQFLNELIRLMGFTRDDVYIANVLKCRPNAATGNRKPDTTEMESCLPFLFDQIRIIRPKVIIALGGTAMEGLFREPCAITRERGHVRPFPDLPEMNDYPVMPTFHPAYVLRHLDEKTRRQVWRDICAAMELADYDTSGRKDWLPEI